MTVLDEILIWLVGFVITWYMHLYARAAFALQELRRLQKERNITLEYFRKARSTGGLGPELRETLNSIEAQMNDRVNEAEKEYRSVRERIWVP